MQDKTNNKLGFKDMDEPLRRYFISRLIIGALMMIVLTLLSLWAKTYTIIFIPLAAYVLYIGYILFTITRIVNGHGMKIEAVVLEKTGDTPTTAMKLMSANMQKKPTTPKITVMTIGEQAMVEITLKRPYTEYEEGNKIIIYAPDGSIKSATKDKYVMDSYYCIYKEYSDYRNELSKKSGQNP